MSVSGSCWGAVMLAAMFLLKDVESARCPEDALWTASSCFPSLSHGLLSNLTSVRLHCLNGIFEKSIACLAGIDASCNNNKKQLKILQSYLDVERWRRNWHDLCASVQTLQDHYACWTLTSERSAQCIKKQMLELQRGVKKVILAHSSTPSSDTSSYLVSTTIDSKKLMSSDNVKLLCSASKRILYCFQPLLQELCPFEISRLVENVYLAFQPPLCEDTVQDDSGWQQDSSSAGKSSALLTASRLLTNVYALPLLVTRFGAIMVR